MGGSWVGTRELHCLAGRGVLSTLSGTCLHGRSPIGTSWFARHQKKPFTFLGLQSNNIFCFTTKVNRYFDPEEEPWLRRPVDFYAISYRRMACHPSPRCASAWGCTSSMPGCSGTARS